MMKHLKITVACAGGMSSSMICNKIIAAAAKKGYECECKAYGTSEQYPDVPVEAISMMDYGMMNGEKVFNDLAAKYGW